MSTHLSLKSALKAAVPQRMRDIEDRGGPLPIQREAAMQFLRDCASDGRLQKFVAPGLQVKDTPQIFNDLAYALAVLAFELDGVEFLGERWKHRETSLPASRKRGA